MKTAVAALSLLVVGCATPYRPQPSPRIAIVEDPWLGTTLVKDGQEHPMGFLGSGVIDAVEGNATATERADSAFQLQIGGFVLGIIGSGAMGAGFGLLIGNELGDESSDLRIASLLIAAGGLAALIPGAILTGMGRTETFDAINIYNDEVDRQLRERPVPIPMYPPIAPPLPPVVPQVVPPPPPVAPVPAPEIPETPEPEPEPAPE